MSYLWSKVIPNPAGKQHQNDVVSTSMRRVASTLIRRHFNVVYPLGNRVALVRYSEDPTIRGCAGWYLDHFAAARATPPPPSLPPPPAPPPPPPHHTHTQHYNTDELLTKDICFLTIKENTEHVKSFSISCIYIWKYLV